MIVMAIDHASFMMLTLKVGADTHQLKEGDSVYFDAAQAHSYARACEALVATTRG